MFVSRQLRLAPFIQSAKHEDRHGRLGCGVEKTIRVATGVVQKSLSSVWSYGIGQVPILGQVVGVENDLLTFESHACAFASGTSSQTSHHSPSSCNSTSSNSVANCFRSTRCTGTATAFGKAFRIRRRSAIVA